jgi:hypothetical protein
LVWEKKTLFFLKENFVCTNRVFNPVNAFRQKKILLAMADVNLSFLHGMALESAKLAVNYVRGTGEGDDESAAVVTGASAQNMSLSNVTAVSLLPRFLELTGYKIPKTYRIQDS